jgi:hypothetical protein
MKAGVERESPVFRKMPELHLRLVKVDFGTVGFALANWRVGNWKVGDAKG